MEIRLLYIVLLITLVVNQDTSAQKFEVDNSGSVLTIDGTSNLHDWKIHAEELSGSLILQEEKSNIQGIMKLELNIPAIFLKSGKKGMDKNVYKALNISKYPDICFRLDSVEKIEKTSDNNYKMLLNGYLKIAGTERQIKLPIDLKSKTHGIKISGETSLNMTNYKIDPPTALFGTITTGDRVIIKFDLPFTN